MLASQTSTPKRQPFILSSHSTLGSKVLHSLPPIHPSAFPIAQLTFFSALLLHNTFPIATPSTISSSPSNALPPSPSKHSVSTPLTRLLQSSSHSASPLTSAALSIFLSICKNALFLPQPPMLAPLPNSFGFFHHSIVHSSISQQTQFPSRHHLPCSSVLRIFQQLFTPIHSFPSPPR